MVETDKPEAELAIAFQSIGPVLERFISVDDLLAPIDDGAASGAFITTVTLPPSRWTALCFVRLLSFAALQQRPQV